VGSSVPWASGKYRNNGWAAGSWSPPATPPTPPPSNEDSGWVEITDAHTTGSLTAGSAGSLGLTLAYQGAGNGWQVSGTPAAVTANGLFEGSHLYLDNLGIEILPGDHVYVRFEDISISGLNGQNTLGFFLNDETDASSGRTSGVSFGPNTATDIRGYALNTSATDQTGVFAAADVTQIRAGIPTGTKAVFGSWIDVRGASASLGAQRLASSGPNNTNATIYPFLFVGTRASGGVADPVQARIYVRRIRPKWTDFTDGTWTEVTPTIATGSLQTGSAGALGGTFQYTGGKWQVSGTPASVIANGASEMSYLDIDGFSETLDDGSVTVFAWDDAASTSGSWRLGAGCHVTSLGATEAGVAGGFGHGGSSIRAWAASNTGGNIGANNAGAVTMWQTEIYTSRNLFSSTVGSDTDGSAAVNDGNTSGSDYADTVEPRIYVGTGNNSGTPCTLSGKLYMQKLLGSSDWS